MMGIEDLERIRQRDPEAEIRRWLGGLSYSECKSWEWERKYSLRFSNPIRPGELEAAQVAGMLKKEQLVDGQHYWGICRNARVAKWSVVEQRFFHMRYKGRWYKQTIPYPSDEEVREIAPGRMHSADIFLPWAETEPLHFERVEI